MTDTNPVEPLIQIVDEPDLFPESGFGESMLNFQCLRMIADA
jgi:hypothetical protein